MPGDRDGANEGVLYAGDASAPKHPAVDPVPPKKKQKKKKRKGK